MIMKKLLNYLPILFILFSTSAFAVEWRSKPVQCGSIESVYKLLEANGEVALLGGVGKVPPDPNNTKQVVEVPVYWFYNSDTGSFTVIEFHFPSNEACVISWGGGVEFDVQKYFEKGVT